MMKPPELVVGLSTAVADVVTIGGKAANLAGARGLGLDVPPGFVVTTAAYSDHVRRHGFAPRIHAALSEAISDDLEVLETAHRRVAELLQSQPLHAGVVAAVDAELERQGLRTLAVRSSASVEDQPRLSFAGLYDSLLDISPSELPAAILQVWTSLYTPRAIFYRTRHRVSSAQLAMAVIVQEMVHGEASGVMLTRDPEHRKYILVEAVQGLGERLVSQGADPASYLLSRTSGVAVRSEDTQIAPLSEEVLAKLLRVADVLEGRFGCAQDVEFTVVEGRVVILQTRPLTG